MSEQATCHKHEDGRWLYNTGVGWHPVIEGWRFCPDCGVGFGADGSETPMVPAVTSEAVRGTRLYVIAGDDPEDVCVSFVGCNPPEEACVKMIDRDHAQALCHLVNALVSPFGDYRRSILQAIPALAATGQVGPAVTSAELLEAMLDIELNHRYGIARGMAELTDEQAATRAVVKRWWRERLEEAARERLAEKEANSGEA